MERFYCPDLESGQLDDSESRHCLQVLRYEVGDSIILFDGLGREWQAKISAISGKKVYFTRESERRDRESQPRLILVQSVPKGKAMEMILQKATELGVAEIIPVISERSVARVEEERAEGKTDKWRETLIEAAKQCGQNWLPRITPPVSLRSFLAKKRPESGKLIGSLQPDRRELKETLRELLVIRPPRAEYLFLIGPEGDFTSEEVAAARADGYLPVSLGPLILRSDTAALYALSVLRHETSS